MRPLDSKEPWAYKTQKHNHEQAQKTEHAQEQNAVTDQNKTRRQIQKQNTTVKTQKESAEAALDETPYKKNKKASNSELQGNHL